MLLLSSPSRNCQAAAAQPQAPWFIWQMRVQPQEEQSGFNLPAHQPWATSSSSQLLHIQSAGVPSSLESSWAAFLLTGEEPCGFFTVQLHFPAMTEQWSWKIPVAWSGWMGWEEAGKTSKAHAGYPCPFPACKHTLSSCHRGSSPGWSRGPQACCTSSPAQARCQGRGVKAVVWSPGGARPV